MPHRSADDEMHLFLFFSPIGRNRAAWRRENSGVEALYGLEGAKYSTQRAEAAKMDAVFFADKLFFEDAGRNPELIGYEPLVKVSEGIKRTFAAFAARAR